MTLPASGQISMSQVNTELAKSATATISLNDSAVRGLANVPSGQISMSNLWGASAYPLNLMLVGAGQFAQITTGGGNTTYAAYNYSSFYFTAFNANGVQQFQKSYSGFAGNLNSIISSNTSGTRILVMLESNTHQIMMLDGSGNVQWAKQTESLSSGPFGTQTAGCVLDNGNSYASFVVYVNYGSFNAITTNINMFDSNANLLGRTAYYANAATLYRQFIIHSITRGTGNVALANGYVETGGSYNNDSFIGVLNGSAAFSTSFRFTSEVDNEAEAYASTQDSSGNYYVAGDARRSSGANGFLAKINSNSTLAWQRYTGNTLYDCVLDSANNIYAVGLLGSGWVVFKFDNNGTLQWQRSFLQSNFTTLGYSYTASIKYRSADDKLVIASGTGIIIVYPTNGSITGTFTVTPSMNVTIAASSDTVGTSSHTFSVGTTLGDGASWTYGSLTVTPSTSSITTYRGGL